MSFFSELKRRNVIRTALVYLAGSWLLIQIADVIFPLFGISDAVARLLVVVLGIGFVPVLILSWVLEWTPEGFKKDLGEGSGGSISLEHARAWDRVLLAIFALAVGMFAFDRFVLAPQREVEIVESATRAGVELEKARTSAISKKSIAVIPFRNRSANEENAEFFSDGVHDELLTNLSRIHELKVISRTSVMNYRDTTKNMRQIGEELGVANILEGGVQRAGDMVRINVQLIDAATDKNLWAKVYDRQLTAENIFAIQTEVARAIADALEATLSSREQDLLAMVPTANLEAYDHLLMARQLINRGNWQSLRDAQPHLEKAIELDPEFVEAYVLRARAYFDLLSTGAATLQEINEPWEDSVQTALSLDLNSASAQAAYAQFLWGNGMEGAEDAFEKALQLEPANGDIMTMYATYLRLNFHYDQALQLYESARVLDPLSIMILHGLARIHEARREVDEALELWARVRQIDPSSSVGIGPVSGVYTLIGNMVQSTNWLFKAMAVDPDDSDVQIYIALGYVDFGDYESAGQWLSWIRQHDSDNPLNLSAMAMLNIHQGNVNEAMTYTRQVLEGQMPDRHESGSVHIRTLLIWAVDQDQTSAALKMVRRVHPELFEQNPIVDAGNVLQAIDTAQLLQREKHYDEAETLLLAAIAEYDKPFARFDAGKAQALALLGEKQSALIELRHQVDQGWRVSWRWDTELNPNFESLRDEPEFQAIVEFLRADMARQYQEVQAMEAAGEIPPPPW